MDYFNKKRLAFWGVVLLVIMNVASLTTVWFQQHRPHLPLPPTGPPQDRINAFLRHELELTDAQAETFEKLQRAHFQQAKALHDRIRDLKHELFNELSITAPDTLKAERLAEEIGVQQRELEKTAFYHFLALKRLCTPAQQKKLDRLFDELLRIMDPQRRPPPPDERERPPRA